MSFYNTINESGQTLMYFKDRAFKMESLVLDVFRLNPDKPMTPAQVWETLIKETKRNYLLTSVRRCISDLTKQGILIKLEKQRPGIYNVNNHLWRLA